MGIPTSEVGYTSVMPRREDHEVHKDMWGHWGWGGYSHYNKLDRANKKIRIKSVFLCTPLLREDSD